MLGVRLNTINDTALGEPEQDANTALTELDKGLRSGKVGEQCEAIVRFPKLFEKYPFPILINSSFLKLADVFRMGNNFLRLWVLRVCQQSEKHLDKILNVDEFVRRVFSVLHSNDPVARALALQTLGAVAGIIPDRQNVHHAIRRGLESHDVVEVDAAIYATTQFAAHSNTFAVSMCNKLSEMIECEATGPELRIKLVKALRYVHGGAVKAHDAVSLLRSLLERFPSGSLVRAALTALTAIASHTVVHVPETVEILLSTAVNDARASVRACCVQGLRALAPNAALWPNGALATLTSAANAHKNATPLYLDVMQKVVECPAMCASASSLNTGEAHALREYCLEALLSPDYSVAAVAGRVLTNIAVFCYKEKLPAEGVTELMLGLESIVISTSVTNGKANIKALRITLKCMVDLCIVEPKIYCTRTSKVLGSQLRSSKWIGYKTPDLTNNDLQRVKSILEALCALGGSTYSPESIKPAMPAVVAKLRDIASHAQRISQMGEPMQTESDLKHCEDDGTSLVHLCTVVCQYMAGVKLLGCKSSLGVEVKSALLGANGWTRYRVAVSGLRYAQPSLAADILCTLSGSELIERWLSALYIAAKSDALLDDDWTKLDESAAGLSRAASLSRRVGAGGVTCGAGCSGCGACWSPASASLKARAQKALAASRALAAAHALCTHPPPAVAHTHAQAVRDAAARAGGCAGAVRRAARALSNAAKLYQNLKQCSLYADTTTQRHFLIQQYICNQLVQFMERVTANNYQDQHQELAFNSKGLIPLNLEEKIMLSASTKIQQISDKLFNSPDTKTGITHRHMEALKAAVKALSAPFGWSRGAAMGVRGDTCRVSLAAPRHDHLLPHNQHLALKLDGVLLAEHDRRNRKNEDREIKTVQITVTATPHPRSDKGTVELSSLAPVLTAVQKVPITRDFFSAQQLVSLPAGHYTLGAQAALVDEQGELWKTGPYAAVSIKVHEDPASKGNVTATRARF